MENLSRYLQALAAPDLGQPEWTVQLCVDIQTITDFHCLQRGRQCGFQRLSGLEVFQQNFCGKTRLGNIEHQIGPDTGLDRIGRDGSGNAGALIILYPVDKAQGKLADGFVPVRALPGDQRPLVRGQQIG